MSDKNQKNNLTISGIVKKSIVVIAVLSLISIILSLLLGIILNITATPEIAYPFSGYFIIAIASYITSKIYFKKFQASFPVIVFLSIIVPAIAVLISLALNDGKAEAIPAIVKFFIIFFFMIIPTFSSSKKKRKNKYLKR